MLGPRIFTAVVGLPVILGLFAFGPHWLAGWALLGCSLLCVRETVSMIHPRLSVALSGQEASTQSYRFALFVSLALAALVFGYPAFTAADLMEYNILFGVILIVSAGVFSTTDPDEAAVQILSVLLGFAYGCLPWLAVLALYDMRPGGTGLFLLIAIVWSGDTAAYFGGKRFGKRPLAPKRSPNKTWEGALIGLAASIAAAGLMSLVFSSDFPSFLGTLIAGCLGGIAGQMGDLAESTLKRFARVKDSSAILPGHGGFLDRVDGILFAAPVVWYVLHWVDLALSLSAFG